MNQKFDPNPAPLTEGQRAILDAIPMREPGPIRAALPAAQPDDIPGSMTAEEARAGQRWKGMDGAIAWHLIDRHAEGWADTGLMMNAWLEANRAAQPETNADMVQVPRKALRWLFGEEGEFVCPESRMFRGKPTPFWWRGVFREMMAHEPAQPEPAAPFVPRHPAHLDNLFKSAAPSAEPTPRDLDGLERYLKPAEPVTGREFDPSQCAKDLPFEFKFLKERMQEALMYCPHGPTFETLATMTPVLNIAERFAQILIAERAAPSVVPEPPPNDVIYQELTDRECDEFRQHRGDLNSMLRHVHSNGHYRHAGQLIQHLGAVFKARFDAAIAAHPPRAPLTDDQVWNNDRIMACNAVHGLMLLDLLTIVRAVEAAHGIGRGKG